MYFQQPSLGCRIICAAECKTLSSELLFQLAAGSGGQHPISCSQSVLSSFSLTPAGGAKWFLQGENFSSGAGCLSEDWFP